MSIITINRAFGPNTLPVAQPIRDRIIGYAGFSHWFRADTATLSGTAVTAMTNLGASDTVEQATSGARPTQTADLFEGQPGIVFDGVRRLAGSVNFNADGDHTQVFIGYSDGDTTTVQYATNVRTDANNQVGINFQTGNLLRFSVGNLARCSVAYTWGTPVCVIASISGTTAKMRVNGVDATPGVIPAGAGANAPIVLGAISSGATTGGLDGAMHDAMFFGGDLLADAAFVRLIEAYASRLGVVMA